MFPDRVQWTIINEYKRLPGVFDRKEAEKRGQLHLWMKEKYIKVINKSKSYKTFIWDRSLLMMSRVRPLHSFPTYVTRYTRIRSYKTRRDSFTMSLFRHWNNVILNLVQFFLECPAAPIIYTECIFWHFSETIIRYNSWIKMTEWAWVFPFYSTVSESIGLQCCPVMGHPCVRYRGLCVQTAVCYIPARSGLTPQGSGITQFLLTLPVL